MTRTTMADDEYTEPTDITKRQECIDCLVQQGYTPTLARKVLSARSQQSLPLTIWIVDNSSSMKTRDGRRLVDTTSQYDVRIEPCSRWEDLYETVMYHAQLAALLEAPTKFVLLNPPLTATTTTTTSSNSCPQELSIAERGPEWIPDDLEYFMETFRQIEPCGVTPLTDHLRRIYRSTEHLGNNNDNDTTKIVVVVATDGKPTDSHGFSSPTVDRDFEESLRKLQSRRGGAFVVIRLCTNDENVLRYYQRLDEQRELELEVLDDYLDEAREVYAYNPWLTYSLALHRCRESGLASHPRFRALDWLDERPLTREEIIQVIRMLGIIDDNDEDCNQDRSTDDQAASSSSPPLSSLLQDLDNVHDDTTWKIICHKIGDIITTSSNNDTKNRDYSEPKLWKLSSWVFQYLTPSRSTINGPPSSNAYYIPWNPIRKEPTPILNVRSLERHTGNKNRGRLSVSLIMVLAAIVVAIASIAIQHRWWS